MLYRILTLPDGFAQMQYRMNEVIPMGRKKCVAITPKPFEYSDSWPEINLDFGESDGEKATLPIPDLQVKIGRLFLSARARDVLEGLLYDYGEILPVAYEGRTGCVFNPLKILEANPKLSTKDDTAVTHLSFDEEALIFKTEFDGYYGVFCNESFKKLVEDRGLTGVCFQTDLASIYINDGSSENSVSN